MTAIVQYFQKRPSFSMLILGTVCLVAVGFALVSQHVFDMRPCPWCILQRIVYLVLALLAFVGAALGQRASIKTAGLFALLSMVGIGMAGYQHLVAAPADSCGISKAHGLIVTSRLDEFFPWLFEVTASCAEASQFKLLGLPYELGSGLLFALIAFISIVVFLAKPKSL